MIHKYFNLLLLLSAIVLVGSKTGNAQINCSGIVKEQSGAPLPGANVVIKGTTIGTITDFDGKFNLTANKKTDTVMISMVGYLTEQLAVGTNLEIMLVEDLVALGEVVVVGYGTTKKTDLTGAVSTVKSEDLTQLATANVQQAMQGRASGVMVTSESGEPGSGAKIRIRGTGTINKSDPLYVVDGFPMGNIDFLSPSDIESISVLKDASATAIYGNRGANGVVLVTTKKGSKERVNVNFNMYTGMQQMTNKIDVLNAEEYGLAKIEAYKNADQDLSVTSPTKDTLFKYIIDKKYVGTDWQDAILQNGATQNYNLNVSGGSDKYSYFLSGTYNKDNGIVQNSYSEKYFFRTNNTYKFSKHVSAEANISYSRSEKSNYDFNDYSSPLVLALLAVPITPIYDEANKTDLNPEGYAYANLNERANPVAAINRMVNSVSLNNSFITNMALNIEPIEGLILTSKFGSSLGYGNYNGYNPTYYIGPKDEHNSASEFNDNYSKNFNWTWSNFINYSKLIDIHSFNVMLGQEMSEFYWEGINTKVFGVPDDPNMYYVQTRDVSIEPEIGGYVGESSLFSYFGRLNYTLLDKYLLTVNVRRDASSKIAEDYRWGTFPSFSLGWRISEESFMDPIVWLSNLKLRGGYGATGNEGSIDDPYSLYAQINSDMWMVRADKSKIPGAIQTTTPNEQLQWETTKQVNFGLEFGLFNDMLTGSADYFIKRTEDMIVDNPPPINKGMRSARANVGSMENKGFEFELMYKQAIGDFSYEIGGNITFLSKPMVTELANDDQFFNAGSAAKVSGICRTEVGSEFAYFYGYKTDGLLSQQDIDNTYVVNVKPSGAVDTVYTYRDNFFPGDPKLIDQNGDGKFNDKDKVNLGSSNPDFFYGINLGASYKGFDFKVFIQGVKGVELVNGITSWLDVPNQGDDNLSAKVLDSYGFNGNTDTDVPRLVQGNAIFNTYFNDLFVQNASYLRIKNIQVGYTLPKKWSDPIKMSNFRIYVASDNLLTFTKYEGYDPEVGRSNGGTMAPGIDMATYPLARKFLIGVNVNF